MVHMWVNTVTGCGLPRQEINGPRFGPPVDRPMPLALVPPGWTGPLARQPDRERVCMSVHSPACARIRERLTRNCMRAYARPGEGERVRPG